MARDHARMKLSMWRSRDWRALPWDAQWAYEMLCQQPPLTYVGVIDYRPGRFAQLAADVTTRKVEAAIGKLEAARFVLIDRDTEELLVRSYVRHDGVLGRLNMGKAVGKALDQVVSLDLHDAVVAELARHYVDEPGLAGWAGIKELCPDVMDRIVAMSSTIPLPIESLIASTDENGDGTSYSLSPNPRPQSIKTRSPKSPIDRITDDGWTKIKRETKGDDAWARSCAELVLSRTTEHVGNPTGYVLAAIRNDPEPYRYRRGAPKPSEMCPSHVGEWGDACRCCAADAKAAS